MALDRISAVIITRDAGGTLAATLESLSRFPEVVIYDNGSTDDTLAVAGEFDNVRVVQGSFDGFGPTRNRAAEFAATDWIFSIDADERPDGVLLEGLAEASLHDPASVYAVHRDNRFLGRSIRHAGWGNEWKRRLYNRTRTTWRNEPVHERLETSAGQRVERLPGRLVHDAVTDIGQFLDKTRRYSALRAGDLPARHPFLILLSAWWAFFRTYFLRLGLLEGWRGLVIAWSNANGVFFKYMRAYAAQREPGKRSPD